MKLWKTRSSIERWLRAVVALSRYFRLRWALLSVLFPVRETRQKQWRCQTEASLL